jgi:hypothetical protein
MDEHKQTTGEWLLTPEEMMAGAEISDAPTRKAAKPIVLKQVVMWICEMCLNGEGEMCHVPGCALCRHRVDLPIARELYTVIGEMEDQHG